MLVLLYCEHVGSNGKRIWMLNGALHFGLHLDFKDQLSAFCLPVQHV